MNDNLLKLHINYLKELKNKNFLQICGPFTNNKEGILIIKVNSKEEAEKLIQNDPFIKENYYKKYTLNEFTEANEENNWLSQSDQTKINLASKNL